jgi:hypothetical protein
LLDVHARFGGRAEALHGERDHNHKKASHAP